MGPLPTPRDTPPSHVVAATHPTSTAHTPPTKTPAPEPINEKTVPKPDISSGKSSDVPLAQPSHDVPHPLASMNESEISAMVRRRPQTLGSASLGRTNSGALFGGIVMPKSPLWKINNAKETYGTKETVDFLVHTISRVNKIHPGAPVINIGDISRPGGGHLSPHLSHQSGRDVDIGFYYKDASRWYTTANTNNLDLARTWAFIKVTITETDIAAIFIDRRLQAILRQYATEIGENRLWLDAIFGGESSTLRPILRHEPGHRTHMHLRYYNPIAQESGRRIHKALVKHKKIKPPTRYVHFQPKPGDNLHKLAKRYRTTVDVIKSVNKLKSNRIYANRKYKIRKRGGIKVAKKIVVPERRLPENFNSSTVFGGGAGTSAAIHAGP